MIHSRIEACSTVRTPYTRLYYDFSINLCHCPLSKGRLVRNWTFALTSCFFLSLRPQQPALLSKSSILDTASSCCVQITPQEPQGRETELRFGGSSATQDAKRRNTFSLWHRAVLTLMFINPNRSDVGCACAQGVTSCWQAGQNLIPSTARSLSPPVGEWRCFCTQTRVTLDCYFLGRE